MNAAQVILHGLIQIAEEMGELKTLKGCDWNLEIGAITEIVAHKDDIFNLIRWKEIYEMLEETTDTMEDVADVLQRVLIKNG